MPGDFLLWLLEFCVSVIAMPRLRYCAIFVFRIIW